MHTRETYRRVINSTRVKIPACLVPLNRNQIATKWKDTLVSYNIIVLCTYLIILTLKFHPRSTIVLVLKLENWNRLEILAHESITGIHAELISINFVQKNSILIKIITELFGNMVIFAFWQLDKTIVENSIFFIICIAHRCDMCWNEKKMYNIIRFSVINCPRNNNLERECSFEIYLWNVSPHLFNRIFS